MKNSDLPAMPQAATENGYGCNYGNEPGQVAQGLTKREMFALHAMQGIFSGNSLKELGDIAKENGLDNVSDYIFELSVNSADALLAELDKCKN